MCHSVRVLQRSANPSQAATADDGRDHEVLPAGRHGVGQGTCRAINDGVTLISFCQNSTEGCLGENLHALGTFTHTCRFCMRME